MCHFSISSQLYKIMSFIEYFILNICLKKESTKKKNFVFFFLLHLLIFHSLIASRYFQLICAHATINLFYFVLFYFISLLFLQIKYTEILNSIVCLMEFFPLISHFFHIKCYKVIFSFIHWECVFILYFTLLNSIFSLNLLHFFFQSHLLFSYSIPKQKLTHLNNIVSCVIKFSNLEQTIKKSLLLFFITQKLLRSSFLF